MHVSRPTAVALGRRRRLWAAGTGQVFRETVSGAKTDRARLRCVLGQLAAGDVLMATGLDLLARSTPDLLNALDTKRLPDLNAFCRVCTPRVPYQMTAGIGRRPRRRPAL